MASIIDLKDLLSRDVQQLEELESILRKEKTCLSSSDISQLQALTAQKQQLLDQLRERARQKIRVLVAIGYQPDKGTPSRYIQSTGQTELYELWKQADRQMQECKTQNQNNGRVISHLQKRLSRLTSIFRGAAGQQKLYGAKGECTEVSGTNILASA